MKKPEWLLFDVGGVLLDWRQSSAALAVDLGVSHDELLTVMFRYAPEMNTGDISPQEGWRLILQEFENSMTPQAAIDAWRDRTFWFSRSLAFVADAHAAGYKLAILSNSWLGLSIDGSDPNMPQELSLFSRLLDSSVEGLKKPNPAFYDLAEKVVGETGSSLFFIDDDAPNLEPAKTKHWQTYLFDPGPDKAQTATNELRKLLIKDEH